MRATSAQVLRIFCRLRSSAPPLMALCVAPGSRLVPATPHAVSFSFGLLVLEVGCPPARRRRVRTAPADSLASERSLNCGVGLALHSPNTGAIATTYTIGRTQPSQCSVLPNTGRAIDPCIVILCLTSLLLNAVTAKRGVPGVGLGLQILEEGVALIRASRRLAPTKAGGGRLAHQPAYGVSTQSKRSLAGRTHGAGAWTKGAHCASRAAFGAGKMTRYNMLRIDLRINDVP